MNNENRMYKLQNGTETAIWAHDEIICLREQLAQAQADTLSTKAEGIREAMQHITRTYTENDSEWVLGANAIILRFARYAVKLNDKATIDKGE